MFPFCESDRGEEAFAAEILHSLQPFYIEAFVEQTPLEMWLEADRPKGLKGLHERLVDKLRHGDLVFCPKGILHQQQAEAVLRISRGRN